MTNTINSMKTILHTSNWPLQSYSTIGRTACGFSFNIIDVKQPRINKPGIKDIIEF